MTIEEIVKQVEKAFPDHRVVPLPLDHATGEYIIEGVAGPDVKPRRVTLRVDSEVYDDRHDNEPRFDDMVLDAIARMRVEEATKIYKDANAMPGLQPSSHR